MRPPSYYASIVKSNNSASSANNYRHNNDYDTVTARTTSQQLRSSFSSAPSASYVSRSHLPFVPQSTLVAHCFTGVQSSTRPYGSSSSSSSGYLSLSAATPSSRATSTKRTPGSSGGYAPSSVITNSDYTPKPTTRGAGAYLRPRGAYLNSSASSSPSSQAGNSFSSLLSRPGYRPLGTGAALYQPTRLRERPLLTTISHELHKRSPSTRRQPATSQHSPRTEATPKPPPSDETETPRRPQVQVQAASEATTSIDQEADWSSDITRNISRNKYLIKFREIDKSRPVTPTKVEASAAIRLPALDREESAASEGGRGARARSRQSVVPDREPELEPADAMRDRLAGAELAQLGQLGQLGQFDQFEPKASVSNREDSARAADKKKRPERRSSAADFKENLADLPDDQAEVVAAAALAAGKPAHEKEQPKRRRHVKLRLKPLKATVALSAASVATGEASSKPEVGMEPLGSQSESGSAVQGEGAQSRPDEGTEAAAAAVAKKQPPGARPTIAPTVSNTTTDENTIKHERAQKKASRGNKQEGVGVGVGEKSTATNGKRAKRKLPKSASISADNKSLEPRVPDEANNSRPPPLPPSARPLVEPNSAPIQLSCGSAGRKSEINRIRFREYRYEDFNFLSVLGHGGWGFVILAELREHDACFAVKCIKKITIVEDDDYDSIMIERKVLTLGNLHPFICKLFCTFETEGYLFFVMEYCAGGDLMFHVQREGKFDESRCRFYAAEIICAIRFLHNRHIIYRDLKLDNILLDSRGHVRLVDFGMCQCRTYREEMLPSNFCGTPEYISPEIIKGVPYNHSVDWWSFGVLLYEMAVGKMPFRGNDENELLWNVCYEQIHYPMFLSKELTSLLKLLLEREPAKRMGMATCKAGNIQDQPYFRAVDWKAVEELRVPPPFVPEVTSKRDVQNFDSDFTESTCELSPVERDTLERIDQKQFEKFPYTNPNIFIFDQSSNETKK